MGGKKTNERNNRRPIPKMITIGIVNLFNLLLGAFMIGFVVGYFLAEHEKKKR